MFSVLPVQYCTDTGTTATLPVEEGGDKLRLKYRK